MTFLIISIYILGFTLIDGFDGSGQWKNIIIKSNKNKIIIATYLSLLISGQCYDKYKWTIWEIK